MDVEQWRRARWLACGLPDGRGAAWEGTAAAAVGRLGAVQAQEFDYTLWSLSQRTGQTRDEILAEFNAGDLIRTHTLRPTWHLVRREDLARVQAATTGRVHRNNATFYQQTGLNAPVLAAWRDRLTGLLSQGPLTRDEIRLALVDAGVSMPARTLMGALMWAELEMIIGSGPIRGDAQTYRLLDPVALPDRGESVTWLVGCYLGSHGPSTVADLAAWAQLTVTEIRSALTAVGAPSAEGPHGTCFWLDPAPAPTAWQSPCVALLNGFDEYVSGLSAAGKALLDPLELRLLRFGAPRRVIMIDGTVVGTWRRSVVGPRIRLTALPARPLAAAEREGIEAQADAYSDFAGPPVELRFK